MRKRAIDWDVVLAPPRADCRGADQPWTVRLERGRDFGTGPTNTATAYGMAQMVRNWSRRLGYSASVRVHGEAVVATLWRT